MKKSFIFTLLTSVIIFCSCNGCKNDSPIQKELNVEEVISMDTTTMINQFGNDYRWFETCIALDNFLDEENDGTINEVVNVFQVIVDKEAEYDTEVYKFQHFKDGSVVSDSVRGFWVEDFPLNDEEIKISFDSAFVLINKVNLPKPHSRQVVLRKQIGPNVINPQYIFGNAKAQIYVDAVTGEVSDKNPAFPDGFKFPSIW